MKKLLSEKEFLLVRFDEDVKMNKWAGLSHITNKMREYVSEYGEICKGCHRVYIRGSKFRELFPGMTHYPNERICGYCVYDEDAYFTESYSDDHY